MLAAAVTKLSKVSKVKKFDDVLSDLKQTGKFVKNSDIVITNPTNKTIIGSALNSEKILSNTSSINSKIVKNPYDILKQHKIPTTLNDSSIKALDSVKFSAKYDKPNATLKTNFYVRPNGDVIPATGYRYMPRDAKYIDNLKRTMKIPPNPNGTYITFDKFNVPTSGKLQVPHDASIRGSFDTLQIIDDIRIPNGKYGEDSWLEPITKDFLKYGPGGSTQAITYQKINLKDLKDLLK
ncbi:MAG: hypothetical protein RSD42_02690 [Oscillospiraceae bacterium]